MQPKPLTLAEKANLSTTFTKSPIFDVTAEKVVLRSLLNSGEWYALVATIINEHCFYLEDNKRVFKAMQACYAKTGVIDIINVSEQLGMNENAYHVVELSNFTTGFSDQGFLLYEQFVEVCQALRRQHVSREAVRVTNKYLYLFSKLEQLKNLDQHCISLFKEVQQVAELAAGEDDHSSIATLNALVDDILNPSDELRGLPTGINELDQKLNGLAEGELITFIATPGTGKTAMMLTVLINLVFNLQHTCVFVSYEMTEKQLLRRILSSLTCIESWRLGTQQLQEHEQVILQTFTDKIYNALNENKLIFVDGIKKDTDQLHAQIMVLQKKHNVKAVFVDYLNKIPCRNKRANKNQKLAAASDGLKNIALKLQLPVITAAQVDKESGKTPQPPTLYSIRDASEVGDDSHKVISIFRPALHGIEDFEGIQGDELKDLAVFSVVKNRDGATGRVNASFDAGVTLFKNSAINAAPF